jgi:prolyl oligopeptidase PreP (S9A serine peptidase family)
VYDLYRYIHATGVLKLIAKNPGNVGQWMVNDTGEVIGRVRLEGVAWTFEIPDAAPAKNWIPTFQVSYFDEVKPIAASSNPNHWWALSNRGRDKLALVEIDLRNGTERIEYANSQVDLTSATWSSAQQKIVAVESDPETQHWDVFDPQLKEAIDRLRGETDARITINNFSYDERWVTITVTRQNSGEHVLYDLQNQNSMLLGQLARSRMQSISPMSTQQPVRFKSRDGLDLHGYLTLPLEKNRPFPTVVYVHGGPWARDVHLTSDPMVSFLVNRGYAVLQVNYRGSSGYGKAFQEAAQGEFAGKMHNDLIDGIDAFIAQGVIDPKRIAIMGGSYGGYASLVGMTVTPSKFSCGISVVGVSDLAALIEEAPPYWALRKPHWMRYVGDPNNPIQRADMQRRSPLYKANQVQGPVLLLHGLHDPRVNVNQSIQMANALRAEDKPVELHLFKNAGHGFVRWQDNLRYYRLTEDFLASCLGGRSGGFELFEIGAWLF